MEPPHLDKVLADLFAPDQLQPALLCLQKYLAKHPGGPALKQDLLVLIQTVWTHSHEASLYNPDQRLLEVQESLYECVKKKLLTHKVSKPPTSPRAYIAEAAPAVPQATRSMRRFQTAEPGSSNFGQAGQGFGFGTGPKLRLRAREGPAPNHYSPRSGAVLPSSPSAHIAKSRSSRVHYLQTTTNSPGPAYYKPSDTSLSKR